MYRIECKKRIADRTNPRMKHMILNGQPLLSDEIGKIRCRKAENPDEHRRIFEDVACSEGAHSRCK